MNTFNSFTLAITVSCYRWQTKHFPKKRNKDIMILFLYCVCNICIEVFQLVGRLQHIDAHSNAQLYTTHRHTLKQTRESCAHTYTHIYTQIWRSVYLCSEILWSSWLSDCPSRVLVSSKMNTSESLFNFFNELKKKLNLQEVILYTVTKVKIVKLTPAGTSLSPQSVSRNSSPEVNFTATNHHLTSSPICALESLFP